MDIDILDDAFAINDEDGSFAGSVCAQNPIFFSDGSMRPKIAEKRVMNSTQALRPGLEARNVVNADTQNLGIISRELSQAGFVRRDLARSYGCPGHGEKCQNHRFTAQVAQADILA